MNYDVTVKQLVPPRAGHRTKEKGKRGRRTKQKVPTSIKLVSTLSLHLQKCFAGLLEVFTRNCVTCCPWQSRWYITEYFCTECDVKLSLP